MAASEVAGPPAMIPARSSSIFDLRSHHRSKSNPLDSASPPPQQQQQQQQQQQLANTSNTRQSHELRRHTSSRASRKSYHPDSVVNGILSDLNGASHRHRSSKAISPPRRSSMINDTPKSVWWKPDGMNGEPPVQKDLDQRPPSRNPDKIENIDDDLIFGPPPAWTQAQEKILAGPFDYLFSHPGKDIRSQLMEAFNAWLRVPPSSLTIINKVVGMLHTASLLVDDVEDNSLLRRGVPVTHSIFGVAQTINSANYIYFCALAELQKLNNPELLAVFTEEMVSLHRGQGLDLFWRDSLTCPTEAEYLEMVSNKTGGLFRLAIRLMQAESSCRTDFVPLVNLIGLLFQIRDDFLNLWSPAYSKNKGMCEDLSEGKFSFPIIHAIRADLDNLQLLNILKQKSQDETVKRYAVSYMEQIGSFAYTKERLQGLGQRAKDMVRDLDGGGGEGTAALMILERMGLE